MDCREVKELLQPYIDGELDIEKEKAVKDHISSCGSCKKEYRELEEYIKDMSSLKEVSVPANFLEEINLRIDSTPLYRRIIDKIFLPFRLKLPFEAAGVLALVVIIFFLYSPQESLKKMGQPVKETEESAPELALEDMAAKVLEDRGASLSKKRPAPSKRSVKQYPSAGSAEVIIASAGRKKAAEEGPAEVEKGFIGSEESKQEKPERNKSEPEMITYEIALFRMPVPSEVSPGKISADIELDKLSGMKAKRSVSRDEAALEESAGSYAESEKSSDIDDSIKYEKVDRARAPAGDDLKNVIESKGPPRQALPEKVPDAERPSSDISGDIKSVALRLGGSIVKEELSSDKRQIEYIIVDIPAEKYPVFISEIKKLGILQKEAPPEAQKNAKTQQIRIQIIDQ